MKKLRELTRLYQIGKTLLEYGLDELIPARLQLWPARIARKSIFWLKNRHPDLSRLGPATH